jgi:HPt (histidine-containing phosphotransfer) domain-containing protein
MKREIARENVTSALSIKQFEAAEASNDRKITHSVTPLADSVDAALAHALTEAAKAARFDVVAQLAKELEARRLASEPHVVTLDAKRGAR